MRRAWSAVMIAAIGGFFLLLLIVQDLQTPNAVIWEPTDVDGHLMARAAGLVIQQEKDGVVWASDGFSIYRSEGDRGFLKVHVIKPAFGLIWAAHSRTVRRILGLHELIEVFPLRSDLLLVFAQGEVHRVDLSLGHAEIVHSLRYGGFWQGLGVTSFGIAADDDGRVYYGDYVKRRLKRGEAVSVFRSDDHGRSFKPVHEFEASTISRITAVQWDPFAQMLWMAAGDGVKRSRVGYSKDHGRTFLWIGKDDQDFQAASFVFSEDSVDWLGGAEGMTAKAIRWRRDGRKIERSEKKLPSPSPYLQNVGKGYRLGVTGLNAAGVWLIDPSLDLRSFVKWPISRKIGFGVPRIRLARGAGQSDGDIMISPLRMGGGGTAIYRFSKDLITAAEGQKPPFAAELPRLADR